MSPPGGTRLGELGADARLIAAAARGAPAAQRALYDLLAGEVMRLIARVVGRGAAAEDVFQQAMMRIFEQLAAYRSDAPLGRWARAIALNECRMHLRSPWQRARVWIEEELPIALAAAAGEGAPAAQGQLDLALDAARLLDRLPPRARAIVWLHDVEGCTHEEIGAAFGLSASFSKSQLARAHERLRALAGAQLGPCKAPARGC